MIRFALVLIATTLLTATAIAETYDLDGAIRAIDTEHPAPFGLGAREYEMTGTAPEGAAAAPENLLDPRYAVHALVDSKRTVVIGRSGKDVEVPDTLLFDGDGDGAFAADERYPVKAWTRNLRGVAIRGGTVPAVACRLGGATHRVDFRFTNAGGKTPRLRISVAWCLEATLAQDEARFRVCFQDADADGRFGGVEDRWVVIPDQPISKPLRWYELRGRDEGMFLAGRRFEVKRLRGAEIRLEMKEAPGPDAGDQELARRRVARTWAKRIAKSREEFISRAHLDTTRPSASRELTWLHQTFELARARAKLTGKPLLVDLRAFWNGRAYLLDAYTYRDAEVARLLGNRFILLRVIQEQEQAGDHARLTKELKARGREPILGVWDPEGKLVHVIRGWQRPADLVEEIDKVFEKLRSELPTEVESNGGRR